MLYNFFRLSQYRICKTKHTYTRSVIHYIPITNPLFNSENYTILWFYKNTSTERLWEILVDYLLVVCFYSLGIDNFTFVHEYKNEKCYPRRKTVEKSTHSKIYYDVLNIIEDFQSTNTTRSIKMPRSF